eukprot:99325_1
MAFTSISTLSPNTPSKSYSKLNFMVLILSLLFSITNPNTFICGSMGHNNTESCLSLISLNELYETDDVFVFSIQHINNKLCLQNASLSTTNYYNSSKCTSYYYYNFEEEMSMSYTIYMQNLYELVKGFRFHISAQVKRSLLYIVILDIGMIYVVKYIVMEDNSPEDGNRYGLYCN